MKRMETQRWWKKKMLILIQDISIRTLSLSLTLNVITNRCLTSIQLFSWSSFVLLHFFLFRSFFIHLRHSMVQLLTVCDFDYFSFSFDSTIHAKICSCMLPNVLFIQAHKWVCYWRYCVSYHRPFIGPSLTNAMQTYLRVSCLNAWRFKIVSFISWSNNRPFVLAFSI